MLVLDSSAQERWRGEGKRESSAELRQRALAQEIASNTVSVNIEDGYDCSSLQQRLGRPLLTEEVKRRLLLCNPNLVCERCINFPAMTGIYLDKDERTPAGTWTKRKVFLFTMASTEIMPEMEVAHVTMKKVPNPDFVNATGGQKVDRDTVKWIEVPTVYDLTRGWRTVLLRLLKARLITEADVENHFGWVPSKDSKNWGIQTR
jgi:hypothetical protein